MRARPVLCENWESPGDVNIDSLLDSLLASGYQRLCWRVLMLGWFPSFFGERSLQTNASAVEVFPMSSGCPNNVAHTVRVDAATTTCGVTKPKPTFKSSPLHFGAKATAAKVMFRRVIGVAGTLRLNV
eukprot:3771509-Amphidinium_carterae.1